MLNSSRTRSHKSAVSTWDVSQNDRRHWAKLDSHEHELLAAFRYP